MTRMRKNANIVVILEGVITSPIFGEGKGEVSFHIKIDHNKWLPKEDRFDVTTTRAEVYCAKACASHVLAHGKPKTMCRVRGGLFNPSKGNDFLAIRADSVDFEVSRPLPAPERPARQPVRLPGGPPAAA
jgi:hypothetical protein